jgi:hypothetical protein
VLGGGGAVNVERCCEFRDPCIGLATSDELGDLVVAEALLAAPWWARCRSLGELQQVLEVF